MIDFSQRVALVRGAGRGLAFACVGAFAGRGSSTMVCEDVRMSAYSAPIGGKYRAQGDR